MAGQRIRIRLKAYDHRVIDQSEGDARIGIVGSGRRELRPGMGGAIPLPGIEVEGFALERNFLHAAELEFVHPRTGEKLALDAALPEELVQVLERVRGAS